MIQIWIYFYICITLFLFILILYYIKYKKNIYSILEPIQNQNIDYIKQFTIFCFWTGSNEMSDNRKKCLLDLKSNSKCNVILVTPETLDEYILPQHPLHQSYTYLSETHKADYLRTYFMHFHGGGYSDVKMPSTSWINAFHDMQNNPNCYINGYHEPDPGGIANLDVQHLWQELVGNCAYIVRPNTEFTQKWYGSMLAFLDTNLEELRQNPSTYPQTQKGDGTNYPLEWNELLGRIFHKISVDYIPNMLYSVPIPILSNYR